MPGPPPPEKGGLTGPKAPKHAPRARAAPARGQHGATRMGPAAWGAEAGPGPRTGQAETVHGAPARGADRQTRHAPYGAAHGARTTAPSPARGVRRRRTGPPHGAWPERPHGPDRSARTRRNTRRMAPPHSAKQDATGAHRTLRTPHAPLRPSPPRQHATTRHTKEPARSPSSGPAPRTSTYRASYALHRPRPL
ncbi:hypothetical protein GCM10017688_12420 [Streptomyces ramulosus]